MNWVFDTYSNVYSTAMMQNAKAMHHAPQGREGKVLPKIVKLFHRG